MGNSIRLGNVTISDVNFNNQFDPKVDLVTDSFGKILNSHQRKQELGRVLKFLQVGQWKGLRLHEVGNYLKLFAQAKRLSHLGDVEAVSKALQQAESGSLSQSYTFNRRLAGEIYKNSLIRGIRKQMELARQALKRNSNPEEALRHMLDTEQFAKELREGFQVRLNRVQQNSLVLLFKRSLQKALPYLIQEAINAAAGGDIDHTQDLLQNLQNLIQKAVQKMKIKMILPSKKFKNIMKSAYKAGIPQFYQTAWQLARQGRTDAVRVIIRRLNSYLKSAQQGYGLKFNYGVNWADLILEEALIKGINENLNQALSVARNGSLPGVQRWIQSAKRQVKEYNLKFANGSRIQLDSGVLDEIRDCAKGVTACPPPGSLPSVPRP